MCNIVICSLTPKSNFNYTVLGNSVKKIGDVELFYENSNTGNKVKGLSKFYNECLDRFKERDYLVLCHDDVDILCSDLSYQVLASMEKFDVAGVAGCLNPKIIEKNLWHWMSEKQNLRGMAGHPVDDKSLFITSFGPTPSRVVLLDGVFLVLNIKKVLESGTKFDEQFNFHHYDIDFSLTCNKNQLKLGVWPFLINHQSPGLKEFNDNWNNSNTLFINKWKSKS